MTRWWPALALLSGCDWTNPCPTVVYAAGSDRSLNVAVAESLRADRGERGPRSFCYRLTAHGSYDLIDQPDAEVALAERIAADRSVVAVVGHFRSRGSLAAAPVYARMGVPQIVPSATSHLLRGAGPWTFALAPGDSAQAAFMAHAVDSLRARRVILVYSGEPYGEGLADAVRPDLAARRIAIVEEVRLGIGTDIPTLVEAAVRGHEADALLLMADYSQAGAIARTVVPLRPRLRLIASDGAFYPTGLRHLAGAAAESLSIVSLWHADTTAPDTRDFLARFRGIAGRDPTPGEALGYDAMLYARAAITAVGPDRSAVRAWLAGRGGATPPAGHITAATLHDGPAPRFDLVRIGRPPATGP
jgi:branched-chain amino acid transport system substrate-binding protein